MFWLFKKLDQFKLLGLQIWEFSARSLFRAYGWNFIFKVLIRHPIKSIKGLWAYKKFIKTVNFSADKDIISNLGLAKFMAKAQAEPQNLLVATGFCQKPTDAANPKDSCPTVRFTNHCQYYENHTLAPACEACDIKRIVELVKDLSCQFDILTAVRDITDNIFIPLLRGKTSKQVMIFICPFSIRLAILPLFICQADFVLIPFSSGSCDNYHDFIKADTGHKDETTYAHQDHLALIEKALRQIKSNVSKN